MSKCLYTYDFEFNSYFTVRGILNNIISNTNFEKIYNVALSYDISLKNYIENIYIPFYHIQSDYYSLIYVIKNQLPYNFDIKEPFKINYNNIINVANKIGFDYYTNFYVNNKYVDRLYKYIYYVDDENRILSITVYLFSVSNNLISKHLNIRNSFKPTTIAININNRKNTLENTELTYQQPFYIRNLSSFANINKRTYIYSSNFYVNRYNSLKNNIKLDVYSNYYNTFYNSFDVKFNLFKNNQITFDVDLILDKLNSIKDFIKNLILSFDENSVNSNLIQDLSLIFDYLNTIELNINNNRNKITVDFLNNIIKQIKNTINLTLETLYLIDDEELLNSFKNIFINEILNISYILYSEYDDKNEISNFTADFSEIIYRNYYSLINEMFNINIDENYNYYISKIHSYFNSYVFDDNELLNNINLVIDYILDKKEMFNSIFIANLNTTVDKTVYLLNMINIFINKINEYKNDVRNKYNDLKRKFMEVVYETGFIVKILPYYIYNKNIDCNDNIEKAVGSDFVYCITYPVGEFRTFFMLDESYINNNIKIKTVKNLPFGLKYNDEKIYGRVISHRVIDNVIVILTDGSYLRIKFLPENEYITR